MRRLIVLAGLFLLGLTPSAGGAGGVLIEGSSPARKVQFDALEAIEQDFLKLSEPCHAERMIETRLEGVDYRARLYRCGTRLWRLWEYRCPEGYWSHVFLLDQAEENEDAYYLDRFASLHVGRPAMLVDAHRPHCGT